jgi:pimeloyl-ACP methyl ester carboxylesterase
MGVDPYYLRTLLSSWADDFDWRATERELNRLPHFRADIDGVGIHFIHERGDGPRPLPIVLTHGFPSSFLEHLDLLPRLTHPTTYGASADDAFDVVITSLPGYAFSDAPRGPMVEADVADMWQRLMTEGLGYERFGAHGSDVGTGATIELGRRHSTEVVGIHLSAFYLDPPPDPSPTVQDFVERQQAERAEDVAYSRLQSTKPQTVAYGLTDSPAGLAAWIVDLFRAFSDCGGDLESRFTREQLLTNLTIYWVTGTIASAMWPYYNYAHLDQPGADTRVEVPAGFAVFADSWRTGTTRPPRQLAEHGFNVTRWTYTDKGGHFAALEEPDLLAGEIREFFRPIRATLQ